MIYSLTSTIEKSISQFFWAIQKAIFNIIKVIVQAFEFIAGMPVEDIEQADSQNFIQRLFNTDQMGNAYAFMLVIGLGLMIICIIIGLIKAQYNKEQVGATKKVLTGSLKAVLFFVFVPTICILFVNIVSEMMNIMVNGVSSSLLEANEGIGSSINKGIFDVARSNFLDDTITWESSYNNSVMSLFGSGSYNYVLGILVSCIVLYALLIATINIVERLINLVLLYLAVPFVIASSSLDDGARFSIWKDKCLSKFIGITGNILSMVIYLYVSKIAKNTLGNPNGLNYTSVAYICIVIGGAFMCAKGNQLIAGLISHNEAMQEGLSAQQSNAMLHGGMALGGAILHGAGRKANAMAGGGLAGATGGSGSGEAGTNLAGGSGGSATKGLGIGSKIKGGLSAVKNKGLIGAGGIVLGKTMGGIGARMNPLKFRRSDEAFKKHVGEKLNRGQELSKHENNRMNRIANKESKANVKEAYDKSNMQTAQSNLEKRINKFNTQNVANIQNREGSSY